MRGAASDPLLAKQWHYDLSGGMIRKQDLRYGATAYRYDPTGRIEQAMGPGLPSEVFRWDAAANLVSGDHPGGYIEHNRLKMFEDKRFEYDAFGRLSRKLSGHGPTKDQTFEYDDWHQYTDAIESKVIGLNNMYRSGKLTDMDVVLGLGKIQGAARSGLENGTFSVDPATGRLN